MTADLPTLRREVGNGIWLFALLDLHSTPTAKVVHGMDDFVGGDEKPKQLPAAPVEADDGPSGLQTLRDVFAEVVGREPAEVVSR